MARDRLVDCAIKVRDFSFFSDEGKKGRHQDLEGDVKGRRESKGRLEWGKEGEGSHDVRADGHLIEGDTGGVQLRHEPVGESEVEGRVQKENGNHPGMCAASIGVPRFVIKGAVFNICSTWLQADSVISGGRGFEFSRSMNCPHRVFCFLSGLFLGYGTPYAQHNATSQFCYQIKFTYVPKKSSKFAR
ncbi:hypothetical protein B0H19DRAFT_1086179 [Mycena capillaripes]|nr:hypothetical protein B0H19DRAFT_1086179 [Mycena capillaripes]